jgi:2-(1,2-epoxy-1,2-dihydrophenyl)acetyl-CoA isomerase
VTVCLKKHDQSSNVTAMKTMTLDVREHVAWLKLARPERANTFDFDFVADIRQAADDCAGNPEVRAVVITGEGRFFSAGGDAKAFLALGDQLPQAVLDMTGPLHAAVASFAQMDAPVIAAVNGPAAGGGLCLVAMCDLAIAARSAKFVLAFPGIGFSVDTGGTYFLPKVLGPRRALELMLTAKTLDAEEALAWGLVNRVVDDAALLAESEALAKKLAAGPSKAFGAIKRLVHSGFVETMEAHMDREARTLAEITRTADAREGLRAFSEKRPARFVGR